jgi:hypothetical protein
VPKTALSSVLKHIEQLAKVAGLQVLGLIPIGFVAAFV